MTLRAALSSADAKAPYVRRLFHTIADRYDLITGLLSFGRDRRWKATLVALADVRPGVRALDLAAGTGDIAFGLAAKGARVAALDITHRMLQIASAKRPAPAMVTFVTGDMMALPFHDGTFDLVTTGYGVRNVPAIEPAIAEIGRVLRPGRHHGGTRLGDADLGRDLLRVAIGPERAGLRGRAYGLMAINVARREIGGRVS